MRKKIMICILYITSLVFLLSGCGGIRNFRLQYDVDSGEAYYTDSKNGTVYFRIDKRGYVPTSVGKEYAKITDENGSTIKLYNIPEADPIRFLTSSNDGKQTLYSSVSMPSIFDWESYDGIEFSVYYSDESDTYFSKNNSTDIISAIADALENGSAAVLPGHDCETYYLKFSFGEEYTGIYYVIGCIFDKEEYISYIYDRDDKKTVCVGELLNGYLPYSTVINTAQKES